MKLSHLRNIGFVLCVSIAAQERPRITCMIIIDQGGANIINRVLPQCTDGLRWIHDRATRYADAHQPHGAPTTAPGHATLSTGAVAREHGIVGNNWYTPDGKQVRAEYDAQKNPTIDHLMVDTLADQAALAQSPQRPITLINLSLKSRAALMMSGRTQSAWWYDTKTQRFAGLKTVPSWLLPISLKNIDLTWHLRYPRDHAFYQSVNPASYQASCAPTLIGTACDGDECLKTPTAQRMLINALRTGIEEWKKNNIPGELICAISLSGLDKVGHTYGPASYESLDLLAWLDTDLLLLCKDIEAASEGKYCIVFSADHGVQPLVPVVQEAGYSPAHRMTPQGLIAATHDDIIRVQQPFVYAKKSIPLKTISHDLESVPGILHATAVTELDNSAPQIGSINHSLRNLIYPNRIGDVVLTRAPYTLIAGDDCGTKHNSPYDYDTHIPLWIVSPGNYTAKTIWDRVYAHQLAPTLAQLLEIPRPSASRTAPLPR